MLRQEVTVEPYRNLPRWALSFATYSGVVPSPGTYRARGISAITIARNEEDWVETSILSIKDFVNEVLVADDSSDDETLSIIESLAQAHPEKIRLVQLPEGNFAESTNLMIQNSRFQWILRWHADFVARTSGDESIGNLLHKAINLNPFRHYCVALSGIALDGDLRHQFEDRRDGPEPFLYTYSPWLRYYVRENWEALHLPWFYERMTWPEAAYFHMRRVKSAIRLLQTIYWSHWFNERNRGSRQPLMDFIRERATVDYGGLTLDEAAKRCAMDWFGGCVPFREDIYGEYPELLRPSLANPPYELIFSEGKLVDRIEKPRRQRHLEGPANTR